MDNCIGSGTCFGCEVMDCNIREDMIDMDILKEVARIIGNYEIRKKVVHIPKEKEAEFVESLASIGYVDICKERCSSDFNRYVNIGRIDKNVGENYRFYINDKIKITFSSGRSGIFSLNNKITYVINIEELSENEQHMLATYVDSIKGGKNI